VRQESAESSSTTDMEYAGKLHFALRYDKEIEGLVVKVSITQHLFMITNFNYVIILYLIILRRRIKIYF